LLFILVLTYFVFVLFYGMLTSIVLAVFLIETLSWGFSLLLKEEALKYLVIQRFFFFISILGLFWCPLVVCVAIVLKLGLPPFHSWILNLMFYMKKSLFIFMTTIHKAFPLFFFVKLFLYKTFLVFITLVLILRGWLIVQSKRFYIIIIISSFIHSGWMLISRVTKKRLMFLYWSLYRCLISVFFYILFLSKVDQNINNQSTHLNRAWLIISGLPPFTLFWLKLSIFSVIIILRAVNRLMLIMVSILRLASYYRALHLSLSLSVMTYLKYLPFRIFFAGLIWF